MPTSKNRRNELARIHMLAKRNGLDDETYRSMLWTVANVKSAASLDSYGRQQVINHLLGRPSRPTLCPVDRKIYALWQELADAGAVRNRSMAALRAYIRRQIGTEHLNWLNSKDASIIIESLKKWLARVQ